MKSQITHRIVFLVQGRHQWECSLPHLVNSNRDFDLPLSLKDSAAEIDDDGSLCTVEHLASVVDRPRANYADLPQSLTVTVLHRKRDPRVQDQGLR